MDWLNQLRRKQIVVSFLLVCFFPLSATGIKEGESLLTLNPQMHYEAIFNAAVSPDKKHIVTVSSDKTAKIWKVHDGSLVHTLRVPFNTEFSKNNDYLSAATFIDNNRVAIAGQIKDVFKQENRIYIFNINTGSMVHAANQIFNHVYALCASTDKSRIAAALGSGGVKQWDTKNWQVIAEDYAHKEEIVNDCTYTADNHLLTVSISDDSSPLNSNKLPQMGEKGKLRLYKPSGVLKSKVIIHESNDLLRIRLYPNGKKFVVSQKNISNNGFSVGSIESLDIYDTIVPFKNVSVQQNIGAISWSDNGHYIYAADYSYKGDEFYSLVSFDYEAIKETPVLLSKYNSPIVNIIPIDEDNLIVFTTHSFSKINIATGESVKYQMSPIIQFHNSLGDFLTSNDGQRVFLGNTGRIGKKNNILIDLFNRRVSAVNQPPLGLHTSPRKIKNGKDIDMPYMNNPVLSRMEDKSQLVYAVTGYNKKYNYIVGGRNTIFRFGESGEIIWKSMINKKVRSIATPRDGRTIVVTQIDGSISWYSFKTGELLLTMFIDRSSLEWIAWTPEGLCDASEAGRTLLGKHTNKSLDENPEYQTINMLDEFSCSDKLFEEIFLSELTFDKQ